MLDNSQMSSPTTKFTLHMSSPRGKNMARILHIKHGQPFFLELAKKIKKLRKDSCNILDTSSRSRKTKKNETIKMELDLYE